MQALPSRQKAVYDQAFVLVSEKTGKPLANYPYRIKRENGSIEQGITDEKGQTHLVSSALEEKLTIEYEEE